MDLNDLKIKRIISEYDKTEYVKEKKESIKLFRKEIELYIYNFPRLAYRRNRDFCSEFYLYVLDRLDSIIKNYPIDADIQFKTWFNYVLKNQFINYLRYNQKEESSSFVPLENYETQLAVEVNHSGYEDYKRLHEGLGRLSEIDRLLIRFYYLPESLTPDDFHFATKQFGLSFRQVLTIQKNLIEAHLSETKRIRDLTSKISEISVSLTHLKYELHQQDVYLDLPEKEDLRIKNELLLKIARLEEKKSKLIRRLEIPRKDVLEVFSHLFDNIRKARYRLNIAKNKLRFELLKIYREQEGKL